jgi:hypothetical protein
VVSHATSYLQRISVEEMKLFHQHLLEDFPMHFADLLGWWQSICLHLISNYQEEGILTLHHPPTNMEW